MSDPGDKTRPGGDRGALPRTNRPRPEAAQRHTPRKVEPGASPSSPGAAAEAAQRSSRETIKSADAHALTEAAPETTRNPTAGGEPAPQPEDGSTLAERPTQLDTKLASGAVLKQVPLLRADGTPAVSAEDAAPASTYVGCVIDGRYRIEGVLGRGGMGVVYRARHEIIDKLFAIKILLPTEDTEVVERFVNEARAATAIGNAHIVDTVDFGELPDGSTYFVMEYLEGQTLARRIKTDGFIPVARSIAAARQIAEGMGAAHRAGIVHRDLKPENIFLIRRDEQEDFVKLLDFGIAKMESSQNRITRAGTIFGTPHYMSPEQASGSEVDARTDVYAVGVILYEMLSGRVPFDAENPMGLLTQHLYTDPVPLGRIPSPPQEIPSALDAIVLRCLAKKPEDRYESMSDLAADLERVHRGEPPEALADLLARAVRDDDEALIAAAKAELEPAAPRGRTPWLLVGLGVVAVAVASVVALGAGSNHEAPGAAPSDSAAPSSATPLATDVSVALVFSPIDGEVFQNGRSLGGMPVTLRLSAHEAATVEIRREGFYPETVKIDGSRPVVVVQLVPIPGVQPRIPVPTGGPLEALRRSGDAGARSIAALVFAHRDAGGPKRRSEHPDAGGARAQPPAVLAAPVGLGASVPDLGARAPTPTPLVPAPPAPSVPPAEIPAPVPPTASGAPAPSGSP